MGEEADALSEWEEDSWDADDEDDDGEPREKITAYSRPMGQLTRQQRGKIKQEAHNAAQKTAGRWRCLMSGCNPKLDAATAEAHKAATGHRAAAWPVRSGEGTRRAKARNRSGYYDKYNEGKPWRR